MNNIENITFEGAGVFGISYVGALSVLNDRGILDNIKRYSGSSSGSLTATMLSMGCSVEEMYSLMLNTDWESFLDTRCCCMGLFNMYFNFGYNSGKQMEKFLKKIILNQTGNKETTFHQAYTMYNKELYICAVNLDKKQPEYFSYISSPDMPIWKALRMSMAFPYVFSPIKHNGSIYVDGGVMENYPIEVFSNKEQSIGFKIISSDSGKKQPTNMVNYSTSILSSIMQALDDKDTMPYHDQTVYIDIPNQGLLTSVLDIDTVMLDHAEYYQYGVDCTLGYLKNKK